MFIHIHSHTDIQFQDLVLLELLQCQKIMLEHNTILIVNHVNVLEMKKMMKNAREEAVKTDHHQTANGWGKSKPDSIIDYVWYKGFSSCPVYETITKPYMDRKYISDHYPITATLIF